MLTEEEKTNIRLGWEQCNEEEKTSILEKLNRDIERLRLLDKSSNKDTK